MVMSSTSAVEASIQAVSPELIFAPSTSSGFVGAGGAAGAAAGAPAAGAAAGAAAAGAAGAAAAGAAGLSWAMTGAHQPTAPSRARIAKSFFIVVSLERFRAGFAGADADDLLQIDDEDLSVADLSRVGRFFDGFDRLIEHLVLDRGLDLHFRQEIDHVFRATIQLGVTFLPAETLDFGDGDALHADGGQGFPHLVKLERLDDCGNEFHECAPCWGNGLRRARTCRS